MDLSSLLPFQLVNGMIWGLVVALLAVGLNLVFGLLGVVNVAQGALYMLGAFVCWQVTRWTDSYLVGLVTAPLVVGPLAVMIDRWFLKPIGHDHDLSIVMTIGLALVIEQVVFITYGADVRAVSAPITWSLPLFGMSYPGFRVVIAIVAVATLVGFALFLRFTRFGLWMRAVRSNPEVASSQGVPTQLVFAITFGVSAALAAAGGALAAPIVNVRHDMGVDVIVTVFIVVILGGLGNLLGSVVLAVLMASFEGVASAFISPTDARLLVLCLLAVVVVIWPTGLPLRKAVIR